MSGAEFQRPYVISWNLTYRCNLACEHCYLDAGGRPLVEDEAFADRRELSTEKCLAIVDDIAAFAPECLLILTGGEPLLRPDILEIIRHAHARELWVVVGTNGVKITAGLAERLEHEGVRGLALSLDALDAERHDAFRRVRGAWDNTVSGAGILREAGLSFIVQTTVGAHNARELGDLATFASDVLGAKVWNLYFLVPTGRGEYVSDMSATDYDEILGELFAIQKRFRGKMLVNAKCAPHYVKTLFERDPDSEFTKSYSGGAGGCPAGTHYLGIRPNGDVTPCPYLPVFGGNLTKTPLTEIWRRAPLFEEIRRRDSLGGRCGECELSPRCGGCRARAYGMTGSYLAEDPLCTHEPGSLVLVGKERAPAVQYGGPVERKMRWQPEARERMKRIPAFVRGMVTRSVESWCEKHGLDEVTPEILEEIRSRMPTPKVFTGERDRPRRPL